VLIFSSYDTDIEKITPWLLGINFTCSIFSINFTFFSYQLSQYKALYTAITKAQWFNIIILLILPFVPLVFFLIFPEYFEQSALIILPIIVFSTVNNALLTGKYLSPIIYIDKIICDKNSKRYLIKLAKKVHQEFIQHDKLLEGRKHLQTPSHGHKFETTILGIEENDLWDALAVVTNLAVDNNDYNVFKKSINSIFELTIASYSYNESENYKLNSALKSIAQKKLRSITQSIADNSKNKMFFHALINEYCSLLMKDKILDAPLSDIATTVVGDAVSIGQKMLEEKNLIEPRKLLNTLQFITEKNLEALYGDENKNPDAIIDKFNNGIYAGYIQALGSAALDNNNPHFAYRCMETLSYLGCNAAKLRAEHTVISVLEALVQLGRIVKHKNIDCFWTRCLIPLESHVEEFIGHILTWLVDENGKLLMQNYTEQAISRLRGYKCAIEPRQDRNPIFWIQPIEKDGKRIPHIEQESGMYGYSGQLDYSDFSNLKEYVMYGYGVSGQSMIMRGPPMPIIMETKEGQE
jgi:hypothetical protein